MIDSDDGSLITDNSDLTNRHRPTLDGYAMTSNAPVPPAHGSPVPPGAPLSERRSSFRVSQDVIFDYRQVDTDTATRGSPQTRFGDNASSRLLSDLRTIDHDAQQVLKILAEKQPLLADCLDRLNQKIDRIAHHSLFNEREDDAGAQLNLSDSGLAFFSPRALYKGNFLAVRMVFLPGYIPVHAFARVTRCDLAHAADIEPHGKTEQNSTAQHPAAGEPRYRIAAQFHRLPDQDRQELARQILKAQIRQCKQGTPSESHQ